VFTAYDGVEAMEVARREPVDLVITDILMPRMDGYRLALEFLKHSGLANIPFVFYTASYTDPEDEDLASRLGAARFVRKPVEPATLLGVIREVLSEDHRSRGDALSEAAHSGILEQYSDRLVQKLEQKVDELQGTLDGIIGAMVRVVEIRDPYTAGHQERVSRLAAAIADALRFSDDRVSAVATAGLLHDIGKLSVPAEILSKPGTLTVAEFEIIKSHPLISYDILYNIEFPWPVAEIVLQHHERLDGSGYPGGLAADDIVLEARILAVADIVEAMSSHRPYRPSHSVDDALNEIRRLRDTGLDPEIVDACCLLLEREGASIDALEEPSRVIA
jgi:putative two-component system response regulator